MGRRSWWAPFAAGLAAGGGALAVAQALASSRRRSIDPLLVKGRLQHAEHPTAVIVPGILGSGLFRENGTPVWLNVRNAVGYYNLSLPFTVPFSESRDDLVPKGLLGAQTRVPRLFGFTEYYDLLELLTAAGFEDATAAPDDAALRFHVFSYDWRRDLVESARRLHETPEELAAREGNPEARFDLVGHSMGGLVARYYLRYGGAEPGGPVTWAGARRIRQLALVAVPSGGGIHALDVLLNGARLGFSYTTLAAMVVARMPSVYQLLPPREVPSLVDAAGEDVPADLHDPATWERFGWGPYAANGARRAYASEAEREAHRVFLAAALARARALHEALGRPPEERCPVRVAVMGGDTLPTLARAVVSDRPGTSPRFETVNRTDAQSMFEAGDGRVTRASLLASHLPGADHDEHGCGLPEATHIFVGAADHHGIYSEHTFQSILLRWLLKPHRTQGDPLERRRS
jgi:pimeloyl-ACP methyl ester carboxylesterase